MFSIVKTVLAFIAPFLDKIFSRNSEKALELKAQRELEELRAFSAGRISPRFFLFYSLVCIFFIFALLFIASLFFPQWAAPELGAIRELIEMGHSLVGTD